jgi:hypothetical protein
MIRHPYRKQATRDVTGALMGAGGVPASASTALSSRVSATAKNTEHARYARHQHKEKS